MLALSLRAPDGTASVAVMEAGGKGLKSVTEGDSVDESPSWIPSEQKALLFQSAGVGRNPQGIAIGLGPYAIQRLDIDSGNLTAVLEEEANDLLLPRMSADGGLYFVRRPYRPHAVSPWRILTDALLFPFRVVRAIVHFLDFFSLMFSRKPLLTAGGPKTEGPDARSLMLWGRFIDAEKALRKAKQGDQGPLVPADGNSSAGRTPAKSKCSRKTCSHTTSAPTVPLSTPTAPRFSIARSPASRGSSAPGR